MSQYQRNFREIPSSYRFHFRRHCCVYYCNIYYCIVTYAWYPEFVRRVVYLVSTNMSSLHCDFFKLTIVPAKNPGVKFLFPELLHHLSSHVMDYFYSRSTTAADPQPLGLLLCLQRHVTVLHLTDSLPKHTTASKGEISGKSSGY